jgi:hypothetical protein
MNGCGTTWRGAVFCGNPAGATGQQMGGRKNTAGTEKRLHRNTPAGLCRRVREILKTFSRSHVHGVIGKWCFGVSAVHIPAQG